MKQKLIYYMFKISLVAGRFMPRKFLYACTKWIMHRYYRHKPRRVEIMHANIRRAYPELSEAEVVAFGKRVYTELSKTLAEMLLLYTDRIDIERTVLNAEEAVVKLRALTEHSAKGTLFISGHYSNWELLGQFLGYHGFAVTNVVKPSGNPWIDRYIITPFRQRYGHRMLPHKGSMVAMVKTLRSGGIISLLIDQVVQPPNGVAVHFFGHPTAATKAVAMLQQKYDVQVIPLFIERMGEEQFMLHVGDPVVSVSNVDQDSQQQVIAMTQHYYDIIEAQIRQAPEQWLWLYNRWKEIKFAS